MNESPISDLISLSELLKFWLSFLETDDLSSSEFINTDFNLYIKSHMNINEDISEELDSVCRPEGLELHIGSTYNDIIDKIPDDCKLGTLEHQKVELTATNNHRQKFYNRDGPWKHFCSNLSSNDHNMTLINGPDIILSVVYYRPIHKNRAMSVDLEFDVLGQQYLSELRDVFYCYNSAVPIGDFTINPVAPITTRSKDLYPSGFFYIENVFYNDLRNPNSIDYSDIIIQWAESRPNFNMSMKSNFMDQVRFIDLNIRLGWPYVYVHQGNCEHIFMFTDIRMKQKNDCKYRELYPIETYKSRRNLYKCRCCRTNVAKWVIFCSELLPEDPCFLCNTCNRLHHYNSKEELIATEAIICPYSAAVCPVD